jgi:hypothetical protein
VYAERCTSPGFQEDGGEYRSLKGWWLQGSSQVGTRGGTHRKLAKNRHQQIPFADSRPLLDYLRPSGPPEGSLWFSGGVLLELIAETSRTANEKTCAWQKVKVAYSVMGDTQVGARYSGVLTEHGML